MATTSTDDLRAQLVAAAAEPAHGALGATARTLLEDFFADVEIEDLRAMRPEDLLGVVLSHHDTARTREPGTATVRVFNPTVDGDGWSTGHTVVEIVTDDMSFLVDSVVAELNRQGRAIQLLVHPQLRVRRDAAGRLEEVVGPATRAPGPPSAAGTEEADGDGADTAVQESWIHVQVGRESDAEDREALARRLRAILGDVRAATTDWRAMAEQATRIAGTLAADPPVGLADGEAERTRSLLEWLAGGQFVFLGYREYVLADPGPGAADGAGTGASTDVATDDTAVLEPVPGSGLGLLRDDRPGAEPLHPTRLTGKVAQKAREPRLLIITKANSRSTVHRPVFLDYVGVKAFDAEGRVTGERRFLGLFTARAYSASVDEVPFIAEKVRRVRELSGFPPGSHLGKDLHEVLETYPRDELFATDATRLAEIAIAVVHLQERRRMRLFLREDDYSRYMSCIVYLPRESYNTAVRLKMEDLLREAFNGSTVEHSTRVSESVLAMLHFVVRVPKGATVPDVDLAELERALVAATRTWDEDLADAARTELGEEAAAALLDRYATAFPESYKEQFNGRVAVADLLHVEGLDRGDLRLNLYQPVGAEPGERRLKLYQVGPLSLTRILPMFNDLGVEVTDEYPYVLAVTGDDGAALETDDATHIFDFGLRARSEEEWTQGQDGIREVFQETVAAVWRGHADSDGFNTLVLRAGLDWRRIVIVRAIAAYLRQTGWAYSRDYVVEAFGENPHIAAQLVALFEARFDPARADGREEAEAGLTARIEAALDAVASLDQDRILRTCLAVVRATLRTSYYRRAGEVETVALKIAPRTLPNLPEPRPLYEIWVYGPRVEGVHLRFGKVARGGLRWSDRREDFRTEILGLVKAQTVKNAVIVPTGSKGGFVAKRLPDPAVDRDAWQAEGTAAYRQFVSAMLDVTDNRVGGEVVGPENVVRHDDDDPYLVVAADKGTARFSDDANAVAQAHGFWLDDAFASGGSAGYDHKGMGITARGAWESVKRHFRELDVDTQAVDFTVVGIGDMSGDVFGNGMLLSEHIRLVAAFDHRHVFLDPEPDAAASFAERRRLFDLPRSSWADYDTALISAGGGVYPRTAKSVPISEQVRTRLGLAEEVTALTPAELMSAILRAPVDLLWNGGIGTYVKAAAETHAEIGDRANDAIRVDAADLRARVVGEGGNLGVSQRGRVEAALAGVHINTDAIDNSAGVDTSDHEVNLKILLTALTKAGDMTLKQRDRLLASMTDDVAAQVLRHNYEQNVLLGNSRMYGQRMTGAHVRLMDDLEARGELDRDLEFLPDDETLTRSRAGDGLTSPEFAVLVAYAKITLKDDLVRTDLPDEPWLERVLAAYFPPAVRDQLPGALAGHPLRREIIVNEVANSIVNRGGPTFVHRAMDETGAAVEEVARAFVVCREVFGLAPFVAAVEALDNRVSAREQSRLYEALRRLMDRSVRWFLKNRQGGFDIATEIDRFGGAVADHGPTIAGFLRGGEREWVEDKIASLTDGGVPADLAVHAAGLRYEVTILDAVELAAEAGEETGAVLALSYAVSEHLGIDRMLAMAAALPEDDRWDALARGALREDLYVIIKSLTASVVAGTEAEQGPEERLATWLATLAGGVERARTALAVIEDLEEPGLAALSVALGYLRALARA